MYYPKIKKSTAQLELMIQALEMQYGASNDTILASLMAKYFEVNEEDAKAALMAYRGYKQEDYEQQSKRIEYAGL
jgi:hypothetical protein